MFQKLVSRNQDLGRLVERGYAVAFDSNCLIVRDIPYIDSTGALQWGALVAKLEFIDDERVIQTDHQVYFAGSMPHGLNGAPIPGIGGGPHQLALTDACSDVVVERSFSNKPRPAGKFADFFEKIESYVAHISGPAMDRFGVNPYTFRIVKEVAEDSVFKFHDTLTSRAEISELSAKFSDDVVAVIGAGGSGAYIFDFLVKTPVREIRIFDLDPFHVHNAFRSPGRLEQPELGKNKAEVYAARYANFRSGITPIKKFVEPGSSEDLEGVTFAFVAVDKGSSRAGIFDLLLARRIPFIDVGMGLDRKNGALGGMLRATYYPADLGTRIREMALAELVDSPNDLYRTNIQIAELNALNACLAVIKFKQLRGFYSEEVPYFHLLFGVGDLDIAGETEVKEN